MPITGQQGPLLISYSGTQADGVATIENCWSPRQNNLHDSISSQGAWELQFHLVPGTRDHQKQLENHITIILVTRKPDRDRTASIDTCVFHFPLRQIGERVNSYGQVPQILYSHHSSGSLAKKGSLCFP